MPRTHFRSLGLILAAFLAVSAFAQSADPNNIMKEMGGLRAMPDSDRAQATMKLALEIRTLPAGENKVGLALGLANLSTEGDFGRDTLQAVTDTLAGALKETPATSKDGSTPYQYMELAQLAKYEHMKVHIDNPGYTRAMSDLEALDEQRRNQDFTLPDIDGKNWTLSQLHGKVVLVNFWATWCPPCRKEMPDIEALYQQFKDQGFVVLAISNEKRDKVAPFIADHRFDFPVLLDSDNKINGNFKIDGIPKNFVYDRDGHLVAQSIDMRTKGQLLKMLAAAGLH